MSAMVIGHSSTFPMYASVIWERKSSRYSDVVSDGSTFLDLPLREMVNHACQDADMTRRLYPVLLAQLQKRGIAGQFFNHTMKHLQRLGNLEFDGIAVNVGRIDRIKEIF